MNKKKLCKSQEPLASIHCCEKMDYALQDARIPLKYSPVYRIYFLPLKGMKAVGQPINYCPWCGKKLPNELKSKFFEIVKREYGIEPDIDILKNPSLPEEFKSDEWWKKRGL